MSGYTPIFDGLEGRWPALGVWMILLALANKSGEVNMIHRAISAVSGCPDDVLREGIKCLEETGRLERLHSHLDWGWRIPAFKRLTTAGLRLPKNKWEALRAKVFERDDYTCQYCGTRGGRLECDHVFPVSRGGSHDPENLKTACRPCNQSKRAKTLEEWRQ